jgi:hypothetical protein
VAEVQLKWRCVRADLRLQRRELRSCGGRRRLDDACFRHRQQLTRFSDSLVRCYRCSGAVYPLDLRRQVRTEWDSIVREWGSIHPNL